jgi:hypothetical protein
MKKNIMIDEVVRVKFRPQKSSCGCPLKVPDGVEFRGTVYRRNVFQRTFAITSIIIASFLSGCGIFTPRDDFETPEKKSVAVVDRFNFATVISRATAKTYTLQTYEKLFNDNFKYHDLNSEECDKNQFIKHLQQIENLYPRFSIVWDTITYAPDNIISGLKYTVTIDTTETPRVIRECSLNMVLAKDGEYKIVSWDDFPDGNQKSFFAPAGN